MLMNFYNTLRARNYISAAFPGRCFYAITLVLSVAYMGMWGQGIVENIGLDKPTKSIVSDFKSFYTAGQLAAEGKPALAYNYAAHGAKQDMLVEEGAHYPYMQFPYPPFFIVLSEWLASFPYVYALSVWQYGSLTFSAICIFRILPKRETVLATLSFPSIIPNITHGQTGFLTTALIAGYLVLLEKRPWLAGVFIGFLAYKPQFGVLIPIALLAGGYWRTLFSATGTIALMILGVTLLYGIDIWTAFYNTLALQKTILEQASAQLELYHSTFAFVHKMGGSTVLAYSVQGIVQLGVAVAVFWAWRKKNAVDYALKAAVLVLGTLLFTPYILDYDLFALLPALVFLARYGVEHGFSRYGKLVLVAAWFTPAFARQVNEATDIPLGLILMLGLFIYTMRIALRAQQCKHS
jgi:hypothetical protein